MKLTQEELKSAYKTIPEIKSNSCIGCIFYTPKGYRTCIVDDDATLNCSNTGTIYIPRKIVVSKLYSNKLLLLIP